MGLLVDLPFFDLHCRCENTGSVNLASLVCGLLLVLLSWVWYSKGRARLRAETELRDVSTALETLAEPVIMMRGHTITSVNHATLETFGYESKSELEGQGVTVLMQTPEASKHSSFVDRFERTGERRIIGKPRVVTGKRKDGSSVSLTLSVSPCAAPGEYIGILYRRTEAEARAKAESELRDVSTALETLAEPVIMMRGHTITSVNHATLETFGYESKSELEGQGVTVLMQTPEASKHSSFVDRFERTGERRIIGKPRVVTGKRKDGSSVSLTLSVSPCAAPGEYIGILYRRTDAEARAKAEAALLESELSRLQYQLRAGSGIGGDAFELNSPANTRGVQRKAKLVEAWTGEWVDPRKSAASASEVTRVCIAASCGDGRTLRCRWLHQGGELGEPLSALMSGSHAFVKVLHEPFLRVSPAASDFCRAGGHPQLANEAPVLYAGEVEVDAEGVLLRWNNLSGTYKGEDEKCYQTGLPLDRFWALHAGPRDPKDADAARYLSSHGVLLRRALLLSDADFEQVRRQWDGCVRALCRDDQFASATHERLIAASDERCDAVGRYGYLSLVSEAGNALASADADGEAGAAAAESSQTVQLSRTITASIMHVARRNSRGG